jgi:hypothetical protein
MLPERSIRRGVLGRPILGVRRCPALWWKLACFKEILHSTKPFLIHLREQARKSLLGFLPFRVSSGNGNLRTLTPSKNHPAKIKRSRFDYSSYYVTTGTGNTGCLVAQDLALLTKVRTLIHEEISLLTVLYFPSRARTPKGLGCWGATEQNAELGILLQIQSTIKSGVELANALWARIL